VGVAVMEAVVEVAEERRRVEEEGEAAAAAGLWGAGQWWGPPLWTRLLAPPGVRT
jgi:hypothetical protein